MNGRILVIRGGAIGDLILTLPVLAALKRQFPKATLELMGYPHIAQLALAGGLVDRVQSIEARALAGFFARNGELPAELAQYFGGFDLILSYLYDPDHIFETNVRQCGRAQFIACPHRPDEALEIHATDVFLKPLERLAIYDADATPRLEVVKAFATTMGTGRWLAAHPGSGSEKKNWPEANWAALLRKAMENATISVLLVGGEAERDRLETLAGGLPPGRVKLMKSVPLAELAQWLRSCIGFVGHDSGISHLAAALGLPCLVLWGETREAIWRPRGRRLTVLRDSRGLGHLAVPVVAHHLEQLLSET
jgi:heptosyltransferase-3